MAPRSVQISNHYRRLVIFFAVVAGALVVGYLSKGFVSLEPLVRHEQWLRETVAEHQLISLCLAMAAYILLTLVPGLTGKSIAVGWLLGFLPGLIVVNLGLTAAAVSMFLLSRHLIRDVVLRKLAWLLRPLEKAPLEKALRSSPCSYLLALRLFHAPFTVTNYALGTTRISLRDFWWTTQLGLLPGNIAFVLAGASLPSLSEIQQEGVWSFVNLPLLASLTIISLLPLATLWRVERARGVGGGELNGDENNNPNSDLHLTPVQQRRQQVRNQLPPLSG